MNLVVSKERRDKKMGLKVGDYIVNKSNGVCRIEDTVTLDYSADKNQLFFLLVPEKEQKAKIYISVENADAKVRKVMNEASVKALFENFHEIEEVWVENDRERERLYKEATNSCDPQLLIGMIKALNLRSMKRTTEGKKNKAIDEHYFKVAEENLYSEIGFVLKMKVSEVKEMMKEKNYF
ncbi:MAG: CarD family transcriptional regulator [Lachnospiraceae bacterium]